VNPKRSHHYVRSDLQISQFSLSVQAMLFQQGLPRKENNFQVISHLFPYLYDNTPKILFYNLFEDELKNPKASMTPT